MYLGCSLLTVILILTCTTNAVNPGLKMRLTRKGINYANKLAQRAIQRELKTLQIPDHSGSNEKASWNFTKIKTVKVYGPSSRIILNRALHGLTWTLSKFSITIDTNWNVKHKIYRSAEGRANIEIKNANLVVTIRLGVKNEHPSFSVKKCKAHIGEMNIKIHGEQRLGWRIFKNRIQNKIMNILQEEICRTVAKKMKVNVNEALAQTNVTTQIGEHFLVDYGFVAASKVTKNYIETLHKGEVYWMKDKRECPFSPDPIPAWNKYSKMMYVWVTEYFINSFTYVAHTNGFFVYNLTKSQLPKYSSKYLNTTCEKVCVGTIIPQLKEKYPDSSIDIFFNSTTAPKIQFRDDGVTGKLWADVEMSVHTANGSTAHLLTLNVSLSLTVHATVEEEKLLMRITNHNLDLGILRSDIGKHDPQILKSILDETLNLMILPMSNNLMQEGFNLPTSGKSVKFRKPRLIFAKGALLVATDLVFTGN